MNKNNYWLSWWHDAADEFELASPWWISEEMNGWWCICAAVQASNEAQAWQFVKNGYKEKQPLATRFIAYRPRNWSPFNSRFKQAEWMEWQELPEDIQLDKDGHSETPFPEA